MFRAQLFAFHPVPPWISNQGACECAWEEAI